MNGIKGLSVFFIVLLSIFILSCGEDNQKNGSKKESQAIDDNSKQTQSQPKKDDKSTTKNVDHKAKKEFEELVEKKGNIELDQERIIEKGIIETKIVAKRVDNNTEVTDFMIQINQIDNSTYPYIKCFVSVTDKDGNPLSVDQNLFSVIENGFNVPKGNVRSIVKQSDIKKGDKSLIFPINAILAIDKSGSMAVHDGNPEESALYYAKDAAIDFIKQVNTGEGDIVKVIAFDGDVHYLGVNENTIQAVKNLVAKGDTALFGVLLSSVKELEQGAGAKAVILLTDGRNDTRGSVNPAMKKITVGEGLSLAEKLSIPVFTIGFGNDADDETLRKIANSTHALYFSTNQKDELKNLYMLIRNIMNNQYVITYESNSQQVVTDIEISLGTAHKDRRIFTTPEEIVEREKNLRSQIRIVKKRDEELNNLEQNLFEKEHRLTELEQKINKMRAEAIDKDMKAKETMNQAVKIKDDVDKRQVKIDDLKLKLDDVNKRLQQTEKELATLEDQLNKKDVRLSKKQLELEDEDTRIAKERNKLQEMKERFDSIVNAIRDSYKLLDNDVRNTLKEMEKVTP